MQNEKTSAQIDGMQSLIDKLGEQNFIRLTIESSYFFDHEAVKKRFDEMVALISKGEALPARKSTVSDFDYIEDGNGNSNVCSTINRFCGYNLNQTLDKKPFINFIISHVWGNATAPTYFTALWNIVLIPAWADHLMNKDENSNLLSSRLKSTFMAICHKLYDMEQMSWDKIPMQCPAIRKPMDIMYGSYTINIISHRPAPRQHGAIKKITITI